MKIVRNAFVLFVSVLLFAIGGICTTAFPGTDKSITTGYIVLDSSGHVVGPVVGFAMEREFDMSPSPDVFTVHKKATVSLKVEHGGEIFRFTALANPFGLISQRTVPVGVVYHESSCSSQPLIPRGEFGGAASNEFEGWFDNLVLADLYTGVSSTTDRRVAVFRIYDDDPWFDPGPAYAWQWIPVSGAIELSCEPIGGYFYSYMTPSDVYGVEEVIPDLHEIYPPPYTLKPVFAGEKVK